MSLTSSKATNLSLHGISLLVARSVFVVLSGAAIIFFSLGISTYYKRQVADISPQTLAILRSLGMSGSFYAGYRTALVVLLAIGCCIAGIIIFRFKSDEWMAMLVAFTLIGMGTNAFEPLGLAAKVIGVRTPVIFVMAMILASHPLVCYLMPDGKFPQKWMKYAGWFWFSWLLISVFWKSFPVNLFNWTSDEGFTVYLFALLAALLSGIYALIYRYIHTDHVVKRQQLKWVIFSIAVAIVIAVGSDIFLEFFKRTRPSAGSLLIANLIIQTISVLAQLSVPTAMVFSILRYRLYDIELVINRSLVYGFLTIFLGVVFGGILMGLQSLFRAITGQENPPALGVVAATLAVFSLFNPTRRLTQRFVDRRFYNILIDYHKTSPLIGIRGMPQILRQPHFGAYRNLQLIGRGGMAEVYKSVHPELHRPVAIKILPSYLAAESNFRQRFAREAQVVSRLEHPNIVRVYDSGEQDGNHYMVMEYLEGRDLGEFIRANGRLSVSRALPLIQQIAAALDYAHAQGYVHRDIKPSNVLLDTSSKDHLRALLTDFGIAKLVDAHTAITDSGVVVGTFDYIAPEQIQESSNLDGRADIYALGVMAYEMLTGELPFKHKNLNALLIAHLTQPAPDPRRITPELPEHVCEAIQQAMAKKPEERFATASEFSAALN